MEQHLNKIPMLLSQKELRDGRRYKQIDIANGTGLSVSVVSRIMNDRSIGGMTYATAKAFANWLGVAMEELGEDAEE